MSVENFLEPGNRKNLPNARITAGLMLRESSRSLFQRTTWMSGPQAVREDRFQKCIAILAFARENQCISGTCPPGRLAAHSSTWYVGRDFCCFHAALVQR